MGECQFDQDPSRAKWTDSSTKLFADLLVEQIQLGNRPNNVFNKKAWKYIRDEFNKQTNLKLDRQQLKNHLDVLRKRYNYLKALLDHDGFSWDATLSMVIAKDDVWQKYIEVEFFPSWNDDISVLRLFNKRNIQAHPEAETIKKKGCPIYEQLRVIFSDSGANEKCALSNSTTAMHQMVQEQYRAKWTEALEKIFVDLMLEQVLQGNRSNNAFSKKAWKYIRDEFIKKTGLNFDKQQLKNRHGVLRRLCNGIKSLLDQDGFRWDTSLCMVVAENEVWEKYIQEHPEFETIRGKECPFYQLLNRIFSEPGGDGKLDFSDSQPQTPTSQMDSIPSQDQYKQDQSRAKWTVSLDKTFVDLLIEQTRKNGVSNKKAWKHLREQFNKQTGLNFDEQQLRNHQSVLRRVYNNIKSLLDESGFSWNDSTHMVMADVEVWEKYIKAHPEAETIRTKECPIFKQLCKLFSELGGEGRYVQSSHDIDPIVMMDTPETVSISAEPVVDEASSHSAEEGNTSDGRNKRRMVSPLSSGRHKRNRMETSQTPLDAVLESASATNRRGATLSHCGDQFSISSCIKLLNEMQGVDQDLYLVALDLFQDPDRRETFISIKSEIRLAWLKAKCKSLL